MNSQTVTALLRQKNTIPCVQNINNIHFFVAFFVQFFRLPLCGRKCFSFFSNAAKKRFTFVGLMMKLVAEDGRLEAHEFVIVSCLPVPWGGHHYVLLMFS